MPAQTTRPVSRRRGAAKGALFVLLLCVLVGGAMAYRFLFNRPAERAIEMIPADAFAVVTLDSHPSPAQVPIFNRISAALKQEGLSDKAESALSGVLEKSTVVKQIRPYWTQSFALAVLTPAGKDGFDAEPVALLSITDPGKVTEILQKDGARKQIDGVTYYQFNRESVSAAVISSYLVLAGKPADLATIEHVRSGSSPSLAALKEYQEARAGLPDDANLMVFLSPTALKKMESEGKKAGMSGINASSWMAFSATLRDQGVAWDYRVAIDPAHSAMWKSMAQVSPLDLNVFSKLPGGAYGLYAFSQLGKYWDPLSQQIRGMGEMSKGFDEGLADFERETGISVPKDIVPALQGHMWLAAYPDARGPDFGVDGVVLIDDANGADPAMLTQKLKAWVERASAKDGKEGVRFVSTERNGATCWALDQKSSDEMRKGMSETFESQAGVGHRRLAPEAEDAGEWINRRPQRVTPGSESDKYFSNKNLVYAEIGKAVIIASSQEMLDKAVLAYNGQGPNLAADPAFQGMRNALPAGSQAAMMVNLSGIMQSLKPMIEKSMKDAGPGMRADDLIYLFGQSTSGLVMSARYDGQFSTGTVFLPLEYERLVHLVSGLMKSFDEPKGGEQFKVEPSARLMRPLPKVAGISGVGP